MHGDTDEWAVSVPDISYQNMTGHGHAWNGEPPFQVGKIGNLIRIPRTEISGDCSQSEPSCIHIGKSAQALATNFRRLTVFDRFTSRIASSWFPPSTPWLSALGDLVPTPKVQFGGSLAGNEALNVSSTDCSRRASSELFFGPSACFSMLLVMALKLFQNKLKVIKDRLVATALRNCD